MSTPQGSPSDADSYSAAIIMATNTVVTKETPITLKVLYEGETRRFKVRLDELGANSLPTKVCP